MKEQTRLLTTAEAARYLRTTSNTIYRWCRSGRLAGYKVGRAWLFRQEDLYGALSHGVQRRQEGPAGHEVAALRETLQGSLAPPGHWMSLADSPRPLLALEAAFLSRGLEEGAALVKGCWWQRPQEVERYLQEAGLPIPQLMREGRLRILDLGAAQARGGIDAVVASILEAYAAAGARGYPSLWATGSPLLQGAGDLGQALLAEEQLGRALGQHPITALCNYLLDGSLGSVLPLLLHHGGLLLVGLSQAFLLQRLR